MSCPYEGWRDRCRLAAAAATVRGDERSARYLGSLTDLSDDQVAGVCLVIAAQTQPAPTGSLVDQVAAAIAEGRDNRFPDEQYRPDAKWAIRAVAAWRDSNASPREADGWELAAQVLQREVDRG